MARERVQDNGKSNADVLQKEKVKKFLSRFSIRSSKVDRYTNEKSKKSVWFKVWKW